MESPQVVFNPPFPPQIVRDTHSLQWGKRTFLEVVIDADVSSGLSIPEPDIFRTGTDRPDGWRVRQNLSLCIYGTIFGRCQSPDRRCWRIIRAALPLLLEVGLLDSKKLQESAQLPLILMTELIDQVVQPARLVEDIVCHVDVPEDSQLQPLNMS